MKDIANSAKEDDFTVKVQYMPDAVENLRTKLGVRDQVKCEIFVRTFHWVKHYMIR